MPYALIDPNWGEPKVVVETIANSKLEAKMLAKKCETISLYSGYSKFPLPKGTLGSIKRLIAHGYRIKEVEITIKEQSV